MTTARIMSFIDDAPPPQLMPSNSLGVAEEKVSRLEWGNIAFYTPK